MNDDISLILDFLSLEGEQLLDRIEANGQQPPPGLIDLYEEQLYDEFVRAISDTLGIEYEKTLEVIDTLSEVA